MKYPYPAVFCVFILGFCHLAHAQDNKDSTTDTPKKSYFQAGISYLSDNVYLGRKDSVMIPYVTPTFGYYHKSGVYINGSFSYLLLSGQNRVDAFVLEAGYDFNIGDFEGSINGVKNFYNTQSTNVKSEISSSAGVSMGYDFGFIRPSAAVTLSFGTATDYALALGLEHTFSAAADKLEITPSFLLNAGTQNYYGSYYNKRRYGKRKTKNGVPLTYDISADLSEVSKFKTMDYEFNVPIDYTIKKFTFNFTPSFAIPVNPNTVTLLIKPSVGQPVSKTFTESLSHVFYFSLGITCKL